MYNQLFIGLLNCSSLSNRMRSHREPFLDFAFSAHVRFFVKMFAKKLSRRGGVCPGTERAKEKEVIVSKVQILKA